VDPGRIDLATCVSHTEAGEQYETHYSNAEYREKIGSARASNKRRAWLEKDNDLQDALTALPSAKTASINQIVLHISALFKTIDAVLAHNFRNRVRCLKFSQFGRKQKIEHREKDDASTSTHLVFEVDCIQQSFGYSIHHKLVDAPFDQLHWFT
jgi:hypothetical protein